VSRAVTDHEDYQDAFHRVSQRKVRSETDNGWPINTSDAVQLVCKDSHNKKLRWNLWRNE